MKSQVVPHIAWSPLGGRRTHSVWGLPWDTRWVQPRPLWTPGVHAHAQVEVRIQALVHSMLYEYAVCECVHMTTFRTVSSDYSWYTGVSTYPLTLLVQVLLLNCSSDLLQSCYPNPSGFSVSVTMITIDHSHTSQRDSNDHNNQNNRNNNDKTASSVICCSSHRSATRWFWISSVLWALCPSDSSMSSQQAKMSESNSSKQTKECCSPHQAMFLVLRKM